MIFPRWLPTRHFPHLRSYSVSARWNRDLNAKYRYRPPRRPATEEEEYITASTVPVSGSIQAVPPPVSSEKVKLEKGEEPFVGRKATTLPAMKPLHSEPLKQEKPGSREMKVAGVIVPPKPMPPESDECCMSGCVNCVYTLYADDLLHYNESLASALSALRSSGTPITAWPSEIRAYAQKGRSGDTDAAAFGGRRAVDGQEKVEKVTREEIMRDVLADVDPALRAFLELENKIKARH